MTFEDIEKKRYRQTLNGSDYLNGDTGFGIYVKNMGKPDEVNCYPSYILKDGRNNIYTPILESVCDYFNKNQIKWWNLSACHENGTVPPTHMISSQVACINHLFPIRSDHDTVLEIAKSIDSAITDVELLDNDTKHTRGYISFEVVSESDHLNELKVGALRRGEMCTSVDAIIIGLRQDGTKVFLLIEWKYTEKYEDKDLSVESNPYFKYPNTNRGDSRLKSYSNLIKRSEQISCPFTGDLKGTIFFFEPFYQLMRQTLWAEQMIAHKDSEVLKADDFIHLHIIPSANRDLLNKIYPVSQQTMEETWRSVLSDQSKYRIITPKALFSPIHKKDKNLTNYLEHRYWLGDRQI